MASLKKLSIIGIFISILSIFAMSHNANAAETNFVVYNPFTYNVGQVECAVQNGNITVATGNTCVWGPNVGGDLQGRGFSFISTHEKFLVYSEFVYEVYVDVATSVNAELMVPAVWDSFHSTGNFQLISFEKVSNDNNLGTSATYEGYASTYRFVIRPKGQFSGQRIGIEIGDNTRTYNWLYLVGDNWPVVIDTRISSITRYEIGGKPSNSDIVNAINELKQSNQQQVQQERDELEQGQSDLQDAGEDSSRDAEQGGANLLNVISGFFGVITSASPTNCVFNAPLNTYFGNQRLNVDLCALDLPSGIGALTSIIAIGILIPFAIHMFNKFIALFRSFQS